MGRKRQTETLRDAAKRGWRVPLLLRLRSFSAAHRRHRLFLQLRDTTTEHQH
jgi:hypothetical protein